MRRNFEIKEMKLRFVNGERELRVKRKVRDISETLNSESKEIPC